MQRHGLLATCAFIGLAANASPLLAQVAEIESDSSGNVAASENEIVVTGTRIRSPGVESVVPITSLGAEEIRETGNVILGELLEQLPMTRSTLGQQNSKDEFGIAGLNVIDLRGLGIDRTLVLQNGRRHVSALAGRGGVDVNSIPAALVERIDVITGGSSSIYGSDAVAGVVNFVLKRDFEGLEVSGQAGLSSRGDRASQRLSLTGGRNFADGRGNIAISAEYSRAEAVEMTERANLVGSITGNSDFNVVENPNGEPGGSDGIPDRRFLTNLLLLNYDPSGVFIASPGGSATGACSVPAGCLANGFPRVFRFNPNGTIAEANYGIDLRGPTRGATSSVQFGDTGYSRTVAGQFVPGYEQYGINLVSHFEVTKGFSPYTEAKFVRVDFARERNQPFINFAGQQGQTAFAQSGVAGSGGIPIRFDNPYLDATAAATIRSLLPAGTNAFILNRVNVDFGRQRESGHRDTFRVVVGAEGDFNDDWHYDVSYNHGRFDQKSTVTGERSLQRYVLAADAARNAAGQIVCRSQLPGQVTASPTGIAADVSTLAADIAACVPVNLFGNNSPSEAAVDYFSASGKLKSTSKQDVLSAFVNGDLSQLFELPGGPIGFAAGVEWRQEDGSFLPDQLTQSGRISIGPLVPFQPTDKFEVREAFGEVRLPILSERPFFHELSLSAAARVADYTGRTGTVLAWSAGGVWAPISDLRLRANYAVSVRAPNLQSLYQELGRADQVVSDPCSIENIDSGSITRRANCAAAGVPSGFVDPRRGQSIFTAVGGNPLLSEETSKSWTLGAVLSPRFVPGLTLSVDYFNIKIEDAIDFPGGQAIANNCYDAPSLDNAFCSVIFRDAATSAFSSQAPFYALIDAGVNYSRLTTRGLDLAASYRTEIEGVGRVSANVVGTYLLERNNYLDPRNPGFPDQILLEAGTPRAQVNFSLDLTRGPLTFGYQSRFISKQVASQFARIESFREVGGVPPQNADQTDPRFTPDVWYHDFRVGFDASDRLNFYAGVDNAFDRQPPFARYGFNLDQSAAIYDTIGRYFYVGATVRY